RDGVQEVVEEAVELPALGVADRVPARRDAAQQQRDLLGEDSAPLELLRGEDPVERAAELSDVAERMPAERLGDARLQGVAALLGLPADDRDPRLVLRRADVDDEAPAEA